VSSVRNRSLALGLAGLWIAHFGCEPETPDSNGSGGANASGDTVHRGGTAVTGATGGQETGGAWCSTNADAVTVEAVAVGDSHGAQTAG